MCEIAIVPTDGTDRYESREESIAGILQLTTTLYEENPHGLGIVAVQRHEDVGRFGYRVFKTGWTEAGLSKAGVYEFIDEVYESSWRLVIHARYATAGGVDRYGTHPIITNDIDDVPWTGVIHNGVVRGHKSARSKLKRQEDREFATEVDSEVIAHKASQPDPDTFGLTEDEWEVPSLRGNLNYVLFSPEQILIFSDGKYHVSDDCTVACSRRDFNTHKPAIDDDGWFLFTPDGTVAHREKESHYNYPKSRVSGKNNISRSPWSKWGVRGGSHRQTQFGRSNDDADSSDNGDSGNGDWWGGSSPNSADSEPTDDKTRKTLERSLADGNPSVSSDESYNRIVHRGYFVGSDFLLCAEHGISFMRVCPECREDETIDPEMVGVFYTPDAYTGPMGGEGQIYIADSGNGDRRSYGTAVVMRCPRSEEWFVDTNECPTCGVDHRSKVSRL